MAMKERPERDALRYSISCGHMTVQAVGGSRISTRVNSNSYVAMESLEKHLCLLTIQACVIMCEWFDKSATRVNRHG